MKRIYYFVVALCLINAGLKAQPVITYNGNASKIGDTYNFSGEVGSFDPGPAGVNQTWDFSNISPTFTSSPNAVTPASTPYAGTFPEATIALAQSGENNSYIYSKVSTSEMLNVGIANTLDGGGELIIHYTDPVKLLKYPFSFSESYTDSYYTSYSMMEGMTTHEWGNATVTADAWGSVTTPAGTYNTLRIKRERTYTDSIWMAGIFISANTYTQTDYEWYTATSHTPVISISVTGDGTTITYRTDYVSGIEETPGVQVNVFPNPVTDQLTIQSEKKIKNIRLLSARGQLINEFPESNDQYHQTIDFSNLPKGAYFIEIGFSNGISVTRKVIR